MKVAIIGAGLAGLTCALRLHQKNIEFKVYEARQRVGGRVLTILMENREKEDSIFEVGGHNITDGGKAPHMLTLAKELGLEICTEERHLKNGYIFYEGQYLHFRDVLSKSFTDFQKINDHVDRVALTCQDMPGLLAKLCGDNPPLKMALESRLTGYEGVDASLQSIHHNIDTLKSILKGGISPAYQDLSAVYPKMITKYIKGGNSLLPLKIADQFPNRIFLGTVVTKIDRQSNKIRVISQTAGNAQKEELYDKVILAIPASVYQDVDVDPEVIPADRLQTIQTISYGQSIKVFFQINNTAAQINDNFLVTRHQITFTTCQYKIGVMYFIKPSQMILSEMKIVADLFDTWDIKCQEPTPIEDQPFQKYTAPSFYSWAEHPYSKGSYSGYSARLSHELDEKVEINRIPFKILFAPIQDQVYFVGEHTTILDEIGTMEAAVESAERVAKLILDVVHS